MGFIDNVANSFGYMKKSDLNVPNSPVPFSRMETTPYAPSVDRLMDVFEFYRSKIQNYTYAELSRNVPILRNIQSKLVMHVTKEGFLIQSEYVKKCTSCDTDYDVDVDVCDVCGGIEFLKPNDKNRLKLEQLVKHVNVNDYSLKHELKAVVLDMLRYDEGVMLKQFEYTTQGGMLNKEFKGLQRIVPIWVFPNISQIGVLGSAYYGQNIAQGFCPMHRLKTYDLSDTQVCPECGTPLMTADYYVTYTENKNMPVFYNRDEIIRIPLFELSSRFSMVQTLYYKTTSLAAIDTLINDIYVQRKYPNRALFFKLNDISALVESNERNKVELKKDKNFVPMYAIGREDVDGEFVKIIDMLGTMDELKLLELQDKYEKDIISAYNCRIDPATREIMVDPQFIKEIQNSLNEFVLEDLVRSLKINDWYIKMRSSQKEEEANELRLQGLKIQNASGMSNLGFDILDFDEERDEFIFSDKPTREATSGFSSFSSNSRGLENTFGNLPGQEELNKPKEELKKSDKKVKKK